MGAFIVWAGHRGEFGTPAPRRFRTAVGLIGLRDVAVGLFLIGVVLGLWHTGWVAVGLLSAVLLTWAATRFLARGWPDSDNTT